MGAAIARVGGTLIGVVTAASVNKGDTTVTLNEVDGLESGQFISIDGGANTYEIMKVNWPTIDIDKAALAGVPVGKAVAFSPAIFSTFGEVTNLGHSTSYDATKAIASLTLADRYVTVTQTGTILEASPVPSGRADALDQMQGRRHHDGRDIGRCQHRRRGHRDGQLIGEPDRAI